MKEISLEDALTISDDVIFRELDSEAVLLNLDTGVYFGLNEVGTRIWGLIHQHGALRKVFEIMREEYEVAPDVLERDLLGLAGHLCEKGLGSVSPRQG